MGEKEGGEEVKEVDGQLGSGEVDELGRWWERRRREGGKRRVYVDNNGSNPTFICGSHHVGARACPTRLGIIKIHLPRKWGSGRQLEFGYFTLYNKTLI